MRDGSDDFSCSHASITRYEMQKVVLALLAVTISFFSLATNVSAATTRRPNDVFFLVDDLAASKPEKANELRAMLRDWRKEVSAKMMPPNPDFDPDAAARMMKGEMQ